METKIILVCHANEDRRIYMDALSSMNVAFRVVSTFRELKALLVETPYHGVMVDLKTKIKSLKAEKGLAYEILYRYPVVQLRINEETGEIRTLSDGKSKHDETLKDFIESDCRPFEARSIRSTPRIEYHFNVLLSRNREFFEADLERTVTFNVSHGGCFILSAREWELNELVSFRLMDLEDSSPILGEIRWHKPWGKSVGIPGIGVQFIKIKENQLEEIANKAKLRNR